MSVEAVILAAGLSSRMGINKMTLDLGGQAVIQRCVAAFTQSCARILVVTGKYHQEISQCLARYSKIEIFRNPDYEQGMFSSVKAGLAQAQGERIFLCPGDYPLLRRETIQSMASLGGYFLVPRYRGKTGHPVLLDKALIPEILASQANSLRDCLAKIERPPQEVAVADPGIHMDVDTLEDYRALTSLWARESLR